MARNYTPRRASKRWLEGAPPHVLDVLDNGGETADRYTILYTFPLAYVLDRKTGRTSDKPGRYADTFIPYLGTSEGLGVSGHGELSAYDAAQYRYRAKRQRIKWADLPDAVKRAVIAYAEEDDAQ